MENSLLSIHYVCKTQWTSLILWEIRERFMDADGRHPNDLANKLFFFFKQEINGQELHIQRRSRFNNHNWKQEESVALLDCWHKQRDYFSVARKRDER